MRIIGIDPGNDGAIALFDTADHSLYVYEIQAVAAARGRGREIVWVDVAEQFDMVFGAADHCFFELVGAMPKQGSSSNFKFGTAYGGLRAIVAVYALPMTLVTPARWKMTMGITSDKKGSVARAVELFPANQKTFFGPRGGPLDGPAEAALLAYYGAQQLKEV